MTTTERVQVEHLNHKANDFLTQGVIDEWEYDFIRDIKNKKVLLGKVRGVE